VAETASADCVAALIGEEKEATSRLTRLVMVFIAAALGKARVIDD